MSFMLEYINKNLSLEQMENELVKLIDEYSELSEKHLLIYSVDFNKTDLPISICMDDLYTIRDVLRNNKSQKLSFFIETPGGSGEAAEEIATFLRNKYEYVDFLIAGECKSAGTILSMCGDEIYLSETGSLGPIDAQIQIGRSYGSAHDYMKWVEDKMEEAEKNGFLNNFDALMVAQISPNELKGVENSLKYGRELVTTFLKKYKFKTWKFTETNHKKVTEEMKNQRAEEIARKLSDHSLWKSHGRSLNIDTLNNELQLKINKIDDDEKISEIIERIHVLIRLIFSSSSAYKIIADNETKLVKSAIEVSSVQDQDFSNIIGCNVICNICNKKHKLFLNLSNDKSVEKELEKEGLKPFPKNNILICDCGNELNLEDIKNQILNN